MTLQQQLESGLSHHQAGHLAEAERIYRQILAQQPDHAGVLCLLGVLALQTGRLDAAMELIQRAIRLKPDNAESHYHLANALMAKGHFDQAITAYRWAVALNPNLSEAHNNLGSALRDKGRLDEAIAAFRRAIALRPDLPEAHSNLGNALREQGQLDGAVAACRQAIALRPNYAEAHYNLGIALAGKGQLDQAIAAYRQSIALKPNVPEVHNDLGNALRGQGHLEEAIAAYRQAIALRTDYAAAHSNLGNALKDRGQFDEAIAAYRQAIALRPGFVEAYSNLANALTDQGHLDDAIAIYRQAIALRPDYAETHYSLAIALVGEGQLDQAIAAYRRAIALRPTYAEAHSNLLLALNYHPDIDAQAVVAEHRRWAEQFANALAGQITNHANERSPDRRLRVGYVSPDLRRHSISYFLLPLLEHRDPRVQEVYCYAGVRRPDEVTARIKRSCDVWRDIPGLADQEVAQLIRSDGIDILIDLSGHTGGNRLCVFARKPAPIQLSYLGYANTTGMTAIDYRLTDALADPPGMTDELSVEKLWRLPGCAWCYDPLEEAPEVQRREDGPITFGCFNAFAKINGKLVAMWAELLKRVGGSRLLLKSAGAGEASSRQRLIGQFAELGIRGDRIEMRGRIADDRGHLQAYGRIDVALDSYPYDGTTTTCQALWMGVPVVSLAGQRHASRVGVSLLGNVGLPELVAETPEQYLRIAADLAGDLPRLEELRRTLRGRMQSSPLMDAPRFARNVEAAFRQMWHSWCEGKSAKP